MMRLRHIAHARAGDKGNISNISVFAYRAEDYPALAAYLTAELVAQAFSGLVTGRVVRYDLPKLAGFNFVMYGALGGGVTRSLALDAHGKCLSSVLLDLEIPYEFRPK
jgi:hypothetical protein